MAVPSKDLDVLQLGRLEPGKKLQLIRSGLPVRVIGPICDYLGIQRMALAALIEINVRTLQRKNPSDLLNRHQTEHLLALAGVINSGIEYFGNVENFSKWMNTPLLSLGQKTPLESMDSMTGINIVSDEITLLKYGMTA